MLTNVNKLNVIVKCCCSYFYMPSQNCHCRPTKQL